MENMDIQVRRLPSVLKRAARSKGSNPTYKLTELTAQLPRTHAQYCAQLKAISG